MLSTIAAYSDSTAFERLVLDRLCLVVSNESTEEIDKRGLASDAYGVRINLCMVDSFSTAAPEAQKTNTLPLLFGAAWKYLDLLIELALHRAGQTPIWKNEWSIKEKVNAAKSGSGDFTILCSDRGLWVALCTAYAACSEHRHCLVHRLAEFSGSPPCLSGKDKLGVPLSPLVATELYAFVSAAQIAANAVVSGGLDNRGGAHLRYELDRLQLHTGLTALGGMKASKPVVVRMTLVPVGASKFEAHFVVAYERAHRCMPSAVFDLWIDVPDDSGRVLFGRMEDVPKMRVVIDIADLPPYLSYH